jgi:hypothetical protein
MNAKTKQTASLGLAGLIVASLVVLGAEAISGTNLIGEGAPNFGPFPATGIFIVVMGVVGAIIGVYKK